MLRFAGRSSEVTAATFELFNLFSERPDWIIDVRTSGAIPRLRLAGTTRAPVLPGPSALEVAYVDDPRVVTLEGAEVWIMGPQGAAGLHVTALDLARVRIEGTLHLAARSPRNAGEPRGYDLELALDAALVT